MYTGVTSEQDRKRDRNRKQETGNDDSEDKVQCESF
jgi:hypothetical protein